MKTLSIVPLRARAQRTTKQTLSILDFIHRFRHVTSRHIQLSLGHNSITTTNNRLTSLCAKGLIARHYDKADRAANRYASYYLTPAGLKLLKERNPELRYRLTRSVKADATMSERTRQRYLVLADVYAYYKRHHNGSFSMATAFDIAIFGGLPAETADGLISFTHENGKTYFYLIEIYGWGRSPYAQKSRIDSYFDYAFNEPWKNIEGVSGMCLMVVAGGRSSLYHLERALRRGLESAYTNEFQVYTTIASRLDSGESGIWRHVEDNK